MKRKNFVIVAGIVMVVITSVISTAVIDTNSAGTTNKIAKWTSNNTLIDSSIFDNGNVGIGTTSPQATLHVNGNVIFNPSTAANRYVRILSSGSVAGQGALRFDQNSNHFFTMWTEGTGTTGKLYTGYDGTSSTTNAKIVLDNAGNVGIGTTTPGAKLHVVGNIYASGSGAWTSSNWGKAIEINNAKAIKWDTNSKYKRFGIGQTNTGLYFILTGVDDNSAAAYYPLVLDNDGNVRVNGKLNVKEICFEGGGCMGSAP